MSEALPDGDLELRASKGNLAAKAVLGARRIAGGREQEGQQLLFDAMAHGSVYATYEMGRSFAKKDVTLGAAYYRLAYLQGDWKAGLQLYKDFAQLNPQELAIVDARAMTLYRNLLDYKGRHRIPLRIQPRPNG